MGLKKNGKKVRIMPHESVGSQESLEMDEFSDEDDEVFVRHNRNDSEEAGKPLIKRKKRRKQNGELRTEFRKGHDKYKRWCCGPICWTFMIFKTLIGVLAITIISVNYFTHTSWYLWRWGSSQDYYAPCHGIEAVPIWQLKLPKLGSESNIRLVNISKDSHLDLIMGFGTGADGYNVPNFVCDIYFNGQEPCFGGVLAIDGKTGKRLWTQWAPHEVFAITCQGDLNKDGVPDCVAGGRAGVFFALSGKTGEILWGFENHIIKSDLMSVFVAQFIDDLDGDGVQEVLAVHGGDELSDPALEEKMFGRIIIFNGSSGEILHWMPTPDRRESYYPPQILENSKGEKSILFGTGGNSRSGSLYVISMKDLANKKISKATILHRDEAKGMLNSAALVDINGDNIRDIVIATFNSSVLAIDGSNFKTIWNVTFPNSESYSNIAVGYYDEDDIPDFLVKYQYGPGYPVYQYEQTVVLSGKDGSKISRTLTDSIGSQSSPISISLRGRGNDIFIHWLSNCKGHDKEKLFYSFPKGESMHDQMRADLCHALFGTQQEATLLALQKFNETETILYSSLYWDSYEHANATNTSAMADAYINQNPEKGTEYKGNIKENDYSVVPKLKSDFHDVFAELEKELAKNPNMAYSEAEDTPLDVVDTLVKGQPNNVEEVIPEIGYPQPHNVRKNPSELNGRQDTFEYPYARQYPKVQMPDVNYPQYPQQQQGYPQGYPQQQQFPPLPGYPGRRKRRIKRDISKKDEYDPHWGIHRIMSTGTLAPPLNPSKNNDTIDLIFATHWVYPSSIPVLQPKDEKCLNEQLSKQPDIEDISDEEFLALQSELVEQCMKKNGHLPKGDGIYETPSDYDPLTVNMGQLTVYRFSLRCQCNENLLREEIDGYQRCGQFLPYENQGWPSFMGVFGDSKFNMDTIFHKYVHKP